MKTLIDENSLQTRISEMAQEIDEYYLGQEWYQESQKPVIVIGVLTGALFFMADLVRKLSIRTELDFFRASSYPGKCTTSQELKISDAPERRLHDAHILLVDDILDTGNTIGAIQECLKWSYPESIKTAILLRKPGKAPDIVTADFVGFDIPDKFVVGGGLDYDGRYREQPYISVWSENGH